VNKERLLYIGIGIAIGTFVVPRVRAKLGV
jgi:hypothetical protein